MKKIKANAVIFDYGNTIAHDPFDDVLKLKISDFQKALKKGGYKFTRKKIVEKWNKATREINYPHISHFRQEEPIIIKALKELGVKKSDRSKLSKKLLKIYRTGVREVYLRGNRKKMLKSLMIFLKRKRKKLAVFSNGRRHDVRDAIKLYGIDKFLKFILSSEDIRIEKPDPGVFKIVLKKIKEAPKDVVYVGDDPVRDIQTAKKMGIKTILYIPPKKYRKSMPWRKYGKFPKRYKPDATINNLSQLKKIII